METAETAPDTLYDSIEPLLPLGLPYAPTDVSPDWSDWPALPDLFPGSYPGVKSGRDPFVVDIDLDRLKERVESYFDKGVSHSDIARRYPTAMRNPREYDAREVRDTLLRRGLPDDKAGGPDKTGREGTGKKTDGPDKAGYVLYAFRPFDNRWLYWETREKLVDRPRPEYKPHVFKGNIWLVSQQKPRREWAPPQVISPIGCLDLMDRGATCVPAWFRDDAYGEEVGGVKRSPNLSEKARSCLGPSRCRHRRPVSLRPRRAARPGLSRGQRRGAADGMATHSAAGLARRQSIEHGWTGWECGNGRAPRSSGRRSVPRRRAVGNWPQLLNPDTPVPGVTTGTLRPELAAIAVPATTDGRNMTDDDFAGNGRLGPVRRRPSGDARRRPRH